MSRVWIWIVAAFTLVGGYLAWAALKERRKDPLPNYRNEIDAIDARAETEKLWIRHGEEEAVRIVEEKHKEALDALDDKKKAEAEALRKNPSELAAFLVRAGRPRKRG